MVILVNQSVNLSVNFCQCKRFVWIRTRVLSRKQENWEVRLAFAIEKSYWTANLIIRSIPSPPSWYTGGRKSSVFDENLSSEKKVEVIVVHRGTL